MVELQPPIVEAAGDELTAALALYEAEAAAADGGRRGALLLEVARLREVQAADEAAPPATSEKTTVAVRAPCSRRHARPSPPTPPRCPPSGCCAAC